MQVGAGRLARPDLLTAYSMDSDPDIDTNSALSEQNRQLRTDLDRLSRESVSFQQKLAQLTGKLEAVKSENAEIDKFRAELDTSQSQLSSLKEEVSKLTTELKSRQQQPTPASRAQKTREVKEDPRQIRELQSQSDELTAECKQRSQAIRIFMAELARLEDKMNRAKTKRNQLRAKYGQLCEDIEKAERMNAKLKREQDLGEGLLGEVRAQKQTEIENGMAKLKESEQAEVDRKKKLADLYAQVDKLKADIVKYYEAVQEAEHTAEERARLDNIRANPRQLGLDLSMRKEKRATAFQKATELFEQFRTKRSELLTEQQVKQAGGGTESDATIEKLTGELADLTVAIVANGIQKDALDREELVEEEDENELTADELVERIAAFRAERKKYKLETEGIREENGKLAKELEIGQRKVQKIRQVLARQIEKKYVTVNFKTPPP
jgi:chromosome segregation ATPase